MSGRGKRNVDGLFRQLLGAIVSLLVLSSVFLVALPATAANPSANLDQCANDPLPSPNTDGCDTNANQWVNGNLGASKSTYREGDSIPYRIRFDNLSLASHTVTIEWDTTQSSKHAIDYLTTFNRTVTTANPCLGVTGCSGTGSPFPIPADPQVTGAGVTPVAGNFTIFGGTITSVSAYSGGASFPTGNNSRSITITFTASVANPVLAWGGHIATRADWGASNSAVAISGSPYHMRLLDLDGSGGNQDRSLSAESVIFPASITIIKDAVPNDAQDFSFTSTGGLTPSSFILDDDSDPTRTNTQAYTGITTFSTYTFTEASVLNWALTFGSPPCTVTSANGGSQSSSGSTLTIDLKEGENVTCTFINTKQGAELSVTKTADAAAVNAGEQIGFTITVSNAGPGTATGVSLTDNLPGGSGVDWSIATQSGGASCSITGSPPNEVLSCGGSSFNLASGANFSVHVTSPTTAASCKTYNNTANFTTANDGSSSDSDSVTVNCGAIGIIKTADAPTVSAGDQIGFTITVTNTGAGNATGVMVTDTLPPGADLAWTESPDVAECSINAGVLSCDFGTLAPNGTASVHVVSPTTKDDCGLVDNTASVTTTNDGQAQDGDSVTVNCGAIGIIKTADAPTVSAGDQIGFTITVTNTGAGTAKDVTMTDLLPANAGLSWTVQGTTGTWTCAIATGTLTCGGTGFDLAPNGTASVHITSPTTSATCGTVDNTGNVSSSNDGSGQASDSVTVNCPQVSQITPTATTCNQFRTGTAATLESLNYVVRNGNVSAVSPGVFFYWVKLDGVTAGSHTFTITQTITTGNFDSHFFNQASGSNVWTSTCVAVKPKPTITTSNGVTTVTFTASSAGTYFIGIKYDSKSVEGFPAPSPTTVHYDFSTTGLGGSTSGLDLVKK
jgi:uncharacterized repeat protein (TIGR01451 family)